MKIKWVIDPYLDTQDPFEFGHTLHESDADAILFIGGISKSDFVTALVICSHKLRKTPVWFTLGPTDFYGSSIEEAKYRASRVPLSNITHLGSQKCEPIQITENDLLIGVDGWYSAQNSNPNNKIDLDDFFQVHNYPSTITNDMGSFYARVGVTRNISISESNLAKIKLREALRKNPKKIIITTYTTPYAESVELNDVNNVNIIPWKVNSMLGQVIDEAAKANPSVQFNILCKSRFYKRSRNVQILEPTEMLEF